MALRWYQRETCEAVWSWLCANAGNPVAVLPTGSGKSHVIAEVCNHAVTGLGGRALVLQHRKELIVQNAEKICLANPDLDVGIFSAGLGARETEHSVICAGIQSVFKRAHEFGQRHLVLIDEVHLVPHDGEGMYRRFLDDLRAINPYVRLVGLTATPYRLDSGAICRPDSLFHKICYSAPIRRLIEEGHLCLLTTKPADATVDTSELKLRGGEFIPADAERLFAGVVTEACREVVAKTSGRKSILVFASGVDHAEQVAETLAALTGEAVKVVTGETWPMERANTLADFKAGRLRWCVNCDVLTTGFDAPNIDAIAVLRATMSAGLFAQMVGRGFRTCDGKTDCLILDFGGNIRRHGPIDDPSYGIQDTRQKTAGEAPVKPCPNCGTDCLIAAAECRECGWRFPRDREANHDERAEEAQILSEPETFLVDAINYGLHTKRKAAPGDPPTMRVDYECQREDGGGDLSHEVISEWVCLSHNGFARKKAVKWWRSRSLADVPDSVEDAVDLARRGAVAACVRLVARKEGRWWRLVRTDLDERPEVWSEEAVDEFEGIPF